jgi:hypothetical protein
MTEFALQYTFSQILSRLLSDSTDTSSSDGSGDAMEAGSEEEEDAPPLPTDPLPDRAKALLRGWQRGEVLNAVINPYLPCVLHHVIASLGNDLVSRATCDIEHCKSIVYLLRCVVAKGGWCHGHWADIPHAMDGAAHRRNQIDIHLASCPEVAQRGNKYP